MADSAVAHIPENIIVRIKKLLQIANYGKKGDGSVGSENEVDQTMAHIQKLLAAYNVEASTIEALTDPSLPPEEKRVKDEHDKLATQKWQVRLWKTVADCNFCLHLSTSVYKDYQTPDPARLARGWYADECDKVWVSRKIGDKHYLIGRESNVLATKMMATYIEGMVNANNPYKIERRDKALSWKEGCVERVRSRLLDRKREMLLAERKKAETPDGGPGCTSLALRTVYQSEYEKNIDAEWGEGTAARWKADREEKKRQQEADDERREMIMDHPQCFTREEYNEAVQHVARLRKQAENEQRSSARESDRYWDGKNLAAWYEGQRAGDKIGLDPQMSTTNTRMLED